ncbi:hypothetical protein JEV46_21775 [Pseudomonas aeruginosa]|uniref:hypothetical protein n=1 Tax=Pseudomonas aeruginosa TaxID=287 RepID=UPI0011C0D4C1|nr:hypothetical protein [Pseudomonas aeruginosa]MBI7389777.1 hypothetical protein [Pseudomonas aeruginosa]NPZ68996.1 hypothetical protein [Pseudomonas aeruginosa]HBO8167725.1 hypothetical protein [Pseudomonas aeruginosa]HCE8410366.1 hypothetical protein [Pseudomonas aeruginosa]
MRSKHFITIAAVAFFGIVCAQMPVPLLDNEPAAPVATPMQQVTLECEELPDRPATCALLPRKPAGEGAGGVPQHVSGRSAATCRAASNSGGRRQHVCVSAP